MYSVDLPKTLGIRWLRESLQQGHELSAAVLAIKDLHSGSFRVIAPKDANLASPGLSTGGIIAVKAANTGLARELKVLALQGAKCVIVEDDLANRGDVALEKLAAPSTFINKHVIHWHDMTASSTENCVRTIRAGASGYPLNAFLTKMSHTEFGLVRDSPAPETLAHDVARSLVSVIVSAFDAESFVFWHPYDGLTRSRVFPEVVLAESGNAEPVKHFETSSQLFF